MINTYTETGFWIALVATGAVWIGLEMLFHGGVVYPNHISMFVGALIGIVAGRYCYGRESQ